MEELESLKNIGDGDLEDATVGGEGSCDEELAVGDEDNAELVGPLVVVSERATDVHVEDLDVTRIDRIRRLCAQDLVPRLVRPADFVDLGHGLAVLELLAMPESLVDDEALLRVLQVLGGDPGPVEQLHHHLLRQAEHHLVRPDDDHFHRLSVVNDRLLLVVISPTPQPYKF